MSDYKKFTETKQGGPMKSGKIKTDKSEKDLPKDLKKSENNKTIEKKSN
jgi:hypothetical protein